MVFSKKNLKQQAKKKNLKFPNKPQQQKYRTLLKKLTHKLRAGTLKAKQLKELKLKKKLKVVTKLKKNIQKNAIKQQLNNTL